jgi:predicted nucleic acid-binding protein
LIILDTNVVSELMAPLPSRLVEEWVRRRRPADDLFVSAVTVAEILYGIELLPQGERRSGLLIQADAMFGEDFGGRVLPFDEPAARIFGQVAALRRRQGRPISTLDAQIAAIARRYEATLATRDISDFEDCGVRLIDPWRE